MLDFQPIPVQSFAAISMKCVSSHFEGDDVSAQHVDTDESTPHRHTHYVAVADNDRHSHSHGGDVHHAHSCSTCVSCCFGGALPAAPTVTTSADVVHFALPIPRSERIASFLTGGIERPRISLV
nr:hypothetical protein [Caballeronia arationis]